MAKSKKCVSKLIVIKSKRGKTIASFRGHSGANCGPRKAPKTAHLKPYQAGLKKASKACKGERGKNFKSCVSGQIRSNLAML